MAEAAYVNSDSGSGTGTSVQPTLPAGWAAGQLCIVDIGIGETTALTVTPPAGWKRMPRGGGHTGGGTTLCRRIAYWKMLDGNESSPLTFTLSGTPTDGFVWASTIYSNVHATQPFDSASLTFTQSGVNNVAVASTAFTTTDDDTLLHKVAVMNGASDITAGTGWASSTVREELNVAGTNLGISTATLSGGVAGSKASELYVAGGTPAATTQVIAIKSADANPSSGGPNVSDFKTWTGGASAVWDTLMPGVAAMVFAAFNLDTITLTNCFTSGASNEFTKQHDVQSGTDALTGAFAYRVLDESDCYVSSPTVTTTPSAAGTPQYIGVLVSNARADAFTTGFDWNSTEDAADTTTPDGGGPLTLTYNNCLIVIATCELSGGAITSAPTDYTTVTSANNGTGGRVKVARRTAIADVADSPVNPGTWTMATTNQFVKFAAAIAASGDLPRAGSMAALGVVMGLLVSDDD